MPQSFVNNGVFTQVGVKLVANEELGLQPGLAYIEDLYGVDGQVTIVGADASQRVLLMPELVTPTPHTEFIGYLDLVDLTPGVIYYPAGRVVDRYGNIAELVDFPDLQFFIILVMSVVKRTQFAIYAPARAMNQRGLVQYPEC